CHDRSDQPDDSRHPIKDAEYDQAWNARDQAEQSGTDAWRPGRLNFVPHGSVLIRREAVGEHVSICSERRGPAQPAGDLGTVLLQEPLAAFLRAPYSGDDRKAPVRQTGDEPEEKISDDADKDLRPFELRRASNLKGHGVVGHQVPSSLAVSSLHLRATIQSCPEGFVFSPLMRPHRPAMPH